MTRQIANPKWKDLPLGMAVLEPGSSKYNRTGDWRSSRPIWNFEKCVKCGVCSMFCPEGCIVMQKDGLPQANMEYCKGCAICTAECWTGCIAMEEEQE